WTPGDFGCGDWQLLDQQAAQAANDVFKKAGTSGFRVDMADGASGAGKNSILQGLRHTHNWVEISCRSAKPGTPGAYVVIDPYPNGGNGNVNDTSSTSSWPAGSVTRYPGG